VSLVTMKTGYDFVHTFAWWLVGLRTLSLCDVSSKPLDSGVLNFWCREGDWGFGVCCCTFLMHTTCIFNSGLLFICCLLADKWNVRLSVVVVFFFFFKFYLFLFCWGQFYMTFILGMYGFCYVLCFWPL
jgi:hypothetical protein